MKSSIRIGLIGDYDPTRLRQIATIEALKHAAGSLGVKLETVWLPTSQISNNPEELLSDFDAYFGAPGAVVNLEGALRGIQYARESNKPYFGTCGGFQYAVLEFARNVLGLENATSEEFDPKSSQMVVSQLSCQVAGKKINVRILPNTLAYKLYGTKEVAEDHFCNYGINSHFSLLLQAQGMKITATDETGEPRIIELPSKRFYMATLFVPQTSSTPTNPHPLLVGYVKAILD